MRTMLARWGVPVLAAAGLTDSAYLALLHQAGDLPPCGGYAGCADVNSSPYAELFGVPIAAFGAGLYLLLLVVGLGRMRIQGPSRGLATLLLYGLVLGAAVFMAYLTGIELFVLHAVCYWCLGLAAITLLLLIVTAREVWALGSDSSLS